MEDDVAICLQGKATKTIFKIILKFLSHNKWGNLTSGTWIKVRNLIHLKSGNGVICFNSFWLVGLLIGSMRPFKLAQVRVRHSRPIALIGGHPTASRLQRRLAAAIDPQGKYSRSRTHSSPTSKQPNQLVPEASQVSSCYLLCSLMMFPHT